MKDNSVLGIAVVALLLSFVAIASAFVITPEMIVQDSSIDASKLADNSVTSTKIDDGTISDNDITNTGISKILIGSIYPDHLSDDALELITGMGEIADNSITGNKIANGTITNSDISDTADIDPSKILGIAWTASNDGVGSGLDADELDGMNSDDFADVIHSHSGLLLGFTVLHVKCTSASSFSNDYTKILDVGTFTKLDDGSLLDVTFNGRIYVQSFGGASTGATFELRIDDNPSTNGYARTTLKLSEAGGSGIQTSVKGIFTDLDAGSHTVSIWVKTTYGTGTNAYVDRGCWNSDHIVIMEFK
jgi:hypothetical protein